MPKLQQNYTSIFNEAEIADLTLAEAKNIDANNRIMQMEELLLEVNMPEDNAKKNRTLWQKIMSIDHHIYAIALEIGTHAKGSRRTNGRSASVYRSKLTTVSKCSNLKPTLWPTTAKTARLNNAFRRS